MGALSAIKILAQGRVVTTHPQIHHQRVTPGLGSSVVLPWQLTMAKSGFSYLPAIKMGTMVRSRFFCSPLPMRKWMMAKSGFYCSPTMTKYGFGFFWSSAVTKLMMAKSGFFCSPAMTTQTMAGSRFFCPPRHDRVQFSNLTWKDNIRHCYPCPRQSFDSSSTNSSWKIDSRSGFFYSSTMPKSKMAKSGFF